MTRDEILKLEAGRELDALIAEKVMGLPVVELKDAPCPYCGSEMRFCGARSWCSDCREWRHSPYKEYSDDIAVAWEVVEKMEHCMIYKHDDSYECEYAGQYLDSVEADTAPLAICRAALLAVTEAE